MIVAVFDTGVILQAILSEGGPASECLRFVFDGTIRLVTSDVVLREIEAVVSRPKLISKYPLLQTTRPSDLIEKIRSVAAVVEQPSHLFKFERDRNDEIFLNLAIGFNVDYLVSRDRDLLDLRTDTGFISGFPSLSIVDPVGFLRVIKAK